MMTAKTTAINQRRQHTIPPPPKAPRAPIKYETDCEKAKRLSDFYTSLYQDIPALSSKDLLAMQNKEDSSSPAVLIVDVRTEKETNVSTLPGAMTMKEFEALALTEDDDDENNRPVVVVVYCTVGYRSGFHARRFAETSNAKIYNLDGILAYTHERGPLIEPKSGKSTNRVHTYSASWAFLHSDYRAIYESKQLAVVNWIGGAIKRIFLRSYFLIYGVAWMTVLSYFIGGQRRVAGLLTLGISFVRWWQTTMSGSNEKQS